MNEFQRQKLTRNIKTYAAMNTEEVGTETFVKFSKVCNKPETIIIPDVATKMTTPFVRRRTLLGVIIQRLSAWVIPRHILCLVLERLVSELSLSDEDMILHTFMYHQ